MRVLHRLATVAVVLLPTSALGLPAALAAPPASSAGAAPISLDVDRSAWSWRRAVPALGLPAEEPSQVPPGGLAVAADLDPEGRPAKATYLRLDLAALAPTTLVSELTLTLPLDPAEDDLDAADVRLVACPLDAEFPAGAGVDPETMPEADCTDAVVGAFDATARAWTFSLISLAPGWLQDPAGNHGVVVRPPADHVLPEGRPFQVNFVGAAEIRAELLASVPAAVPASPSDEEPAAAPPAPDRPSTLVPGALPPILGGSAGGPELPVVEPQSAPVVAAPVAAAAPPAAPVARALEPARSTTGALWSLGVLVALLLVGVSRVAGNTTGPATFARLERQRLDRIRMAVPGQVADLPREVLPLHVPQRRQGRSPIPSATSTVT